MIAQPLVAVDDVVTHLSLEEHYVCRSIETKRLSANNDVFFGKLQVSAAGEGDHSQDGERTGVGPNR